LFIQRPTSETPPATAISVPTPDAPLSGEAIPAPVPTAASLGDAKRPVRDPAPQPTASDATDRLTEDLAAARSKLAAARADRASAEWQLSTLRSERTLLADELARVRADLSSSRDELADQTEHVRRMASLVTDLQERVWDLARARDSANAGAAEKGAQSALRSLVRGWARRLRPLVSIPAALGFVPSSAGWKVRGGLTLLRDKAQLRDAIAVARCGLFDEGFYVGSQPDVRGSRFSPLTHFVLKGGREGRSPHQLFDASYYLDRNPDVADTGANPLVHYLRCGWVERRKPHPLFDVAFYLEQNPDVRAAGIEPLGHFLRFGARDGRNPNPVFDCAYYLGRYPDVAASGINPLAHFSADGWRERRRPSQAFDTDHYLSTHRNLRGENPVAHFLESGRRRGRSIAARRVDDASSSDADATEEKPQPTRLRAVSLGSHVEQPIILCLSHVSPCPPRAGNEYRVQRLLRWLGGEGYRIVPVIAPLPEAHVGTESLRQVAAEFSNAVLCTREGTIEYILGSVPDVLAGLDGAWIKPVSGLLGERAGKGGHAGDLLGRDRTFCHDALVTTALRLHDTLRPAVVIAEYIWMTRLFPLLSGTAVKVVDTHDVFSTKRDKVVRYGVDEVQVEAAEEARRLRHADLVVAIQRAEREELQRLVPDVPVLVAGVDMDVAEERRVPVGRRVLYVASDNELNKKGLNDFLRFAWPRVRAAIPDAELVLAGRIAETLHLDEPGVVRLGLVADLKPLYGEARVVINPSVAGTGLKIKTLEALSHLRPIVTWPSGVEGLSDELMALCTTAGDWYEFATRVSEFLVSDPPRVFSDRGRDTIVREMSPRAVYGPFSEAIREMVEVRRLRRQSELAPLA
jgi:hypothetical protein